MWLTLTSIVGIPVHAVWLVTNEQTEREEKINIEQTERLRTFCTREKTNSCLVKENFLYNIMSFCQENYGLILH